MKKVLFTFIFFILLMFICAVPEVNANYGQTLGYGNYGINILQGSSNVNLYQQEIKGKKWEDNSTFNITIQNSIINRNQSIIFDLDYNGYYKDQPGHKKLEIWSIGFERELSGYQEIKNITKLSDTGISFLVPVTANGWYRLIWTVKDRERTREIFVDVCLGDSELYNMSEATKLANAWQMKPFKDSTANTISEYVKSYARKASELGDNTVENSYWKKIQFELYNTQSDVINAWKSTLNSNMVDTISRKLYYDVYVFLNTDHLKPYTDKERFQYFMRCYDVNFEISIESTLEQTLFQQLKTNCPATASDRNNITVILVSNDGANKKVLFSNLDDNSLGAKVDSFAKGSEVYVYFRLCHQDLGENDSKTFTIDGKTYGKNSGGEKGKDWDYEYKTIYSNSYRDYVSAGNFFGLAKITIDNTVTLKINCGGLGVFNNEDAIYEYIIYFGTEQDEQNNWENFWDVLLNTDKYTPNSSNSSGVSKAEEKIGKILGVITNIGIIVSVIMVAVLGVKYMIGSVEEKAEYKHDMIPYLVGNILLFGICTIVKILQAVGQSFN